MVDIYIPEQKLDKNLRNQYFDYQKAGTLDVLSATADEAFYHNPLNAANRLFEQYTGEGREGRVLSKDEWASSEYFREGLTVDDEGIKEGLANLLAQRHDERLDFRTTLNRSKGGFGLGAAQFAVGFGVSMLDPINIASAFVPSVAVLRGASAAQKAFQFPNVAAKAVGAKKANRFTTGMMDGAIGATLVEPLVIGAAAAEQDSEYGLMDSFLNVTFGAAFGGAIFYGAGKISDRYQKLPLKTKDKAQTTSIGQALADQEINVEPIINQGEAEVAARNARKVADDAAAQQQKSPYDEDYAYDFGDGSEAVRISELSEQELTDLANAADLRLEAAGQANDEVALQQAKDDKEAIAIQQRRNAGEVVERPKEIDPNEEVQAEIAKLQKEIDDIQESAQAKADEENDSRSAVSSFFRRSFGEDADDELLGRLPDQEKAEVTLTKKQKATIAKNEKKISELQSKLVEVDDAVSQPQAQVADVPQVEQQQIQPTPLGRLSEYADDVDEINAQRLEQEELDINEIEAENQLMLEGLTTPENLAALPQDAKDSLNFADIDTKLTKYEEVVEAGRVCVVGSKSE